MEALDGPNRKSDLFSLMNRDRDQDRNSTTRPYTSAMATTAASPTSTSTYSSNGPPPPYTGWSTGPAKHPGTGLISPLDSRRTSDHKNELPPPLHTHRPSLPPLNEALQNGASKPAPYASPVSASLPPTHNQHPYSQAPSVPRTYSNEHATYPSQISHSQIRRRSSPQPAPYYQPSYRPEPPTSIVDSRTSAPAPAPGPPANPYTGRYEPSRYEADSRAPERMSGYTHVPPPSQQPAYQQYGPPSAHVPATVPPGTYDHSRYPPPRDGDWKFSQGHPKPEFSHGLKRHLDVWDFENNLAQINTSSRALMDWSHHYNAIAQEQQRGTSIIPDRMPTLQNCKEMIEHGDAIMQSLARMRELIQQQEHHVMDQRMREQGGKFGEFEDEMAMYGDDMNKHGFAEGKKQRRGRAAPPGRCHSCNRAETPEWRRGPDGARTLCNACGLHYAKLTRKKESQKSSQGSNGPSMQPKSGDGNPPRPN